MFTEEQLIYLKYNTSLSGICHTPKIKGDVFTIINPD
jgi:hypothetical protein